ncbi:MAG: hypothetical protein Q7J46_04165 [Pseudomonas sp.]|nr:hypothetical protein [Pseudomonas sp.]
MKSAHATHLSSAFLIAATRSAELRVIDDGARFESAVVPAIVCAAFSIELGLKSLVYKESNIECKREHKLEALFKKLLPSTQAAIVQELNMQPNEFNEQISLASNAFVDWRYVYEKSSISINFEFLKALASAVEKINNSATP